MKKSIIARSLTAAAVILAMSACSAGTPTTAQSGGRADKLTIGQQLSMFSLNPVKFPVSANMMYAYGSLIFKSNKGEYLPDLATKWGYVGTGNTKFQLTLRAGVKFQDGTDVTAEAVKNSLDYFLATPNSNTASVGPIASVVATDPSTVEISYKSAFPNAAESLTQYYGAGLIIGPEGIKDPASLETKTDGTGPYKYDATTSTAGSRYTFTAKDNYWNPSAIKFNKVEMQVLTDSNSRLNALKAHQVDIASQLPLAQLGTNAANGEQVVSGDASWAGLFFLKTSSGPLANEKVRQALNYAVDRQSIVDNFLRGQGKPQEQIAAPGSAGYDQTLDTTYEFNLDKAKSLLSDGGYPNGFTLKVVTASTSDEGGLLTQVVQSQLAKIGVKVELKVNSSNFSDFASDLASGQYDAVVYSLFATDLYQTVSLSMLGTKTLLNPIEKADPQVEKLMGEAATAADSNTLATTLQKLNGYATEHALSLPLVTKTSSDLYSQDLIIPVPKYVSQQPNIVSPDASQAVSHK